MSAGGCCAAGDRAVSYASCEMAAVTPPVCTGTVNPPADETELAGAKKPQHRTMSMKVVVSILVVAMMSCGYVANHVASSIHVSGLPPLPFGLQLLLEFVAAVFALDLVTGLIHLNFDYKPIANRELAHHVEKDIGAIREFEKDDPLFLGATKEDQFLWNFQIHHDVPYPAADSDYELIMQIARPACAVPPVLLVSHYMGLELPAFMLRCILMFTFLAPTSQFTHIYAHARTRNLIRSPVYRFLQDWHLVLHPSVHQQHHELFDCNFCLFNGWANPIVNRLARLMRAFDILVDEPPTLTVRRERETRAAKKLAADPDAMATAGLLALGGACSES